ncbi:MAG TPA: FkbM family methyltransferase [Caulobacteraceae bacterium]|nr:FkbM family methyltransferase [Caulobacteraceae bacterium]
MGLLSRVAALWRRLRGRQRLDELARAARSQRLYAYLDPQTALTTLHDGQLIFVDPTDEQLTPSIVAYGLWEFWIERVIRRLLKPGDRVIEVGANVGYYTLVMSSVIGPTGRLDAFEASPRMARLLRRSVSSSGRGDFVTVHEKIVADRPGAMHLNISSRFAGAGNVAENGWSIGEDTEVIECEAVRLDDLYPDQLVDMIRIDTEGSEVLILNGAMGIIARSPGIKLCIEWHVGMMSARGDVGALIAALTEMGFRFWRIDVRELVAVPASEVMAQPHCDMLVARSLD